MGSFQLELEVVSISDFGGEGRNVTWITRSADLMGGAVTGGLLALLVWL
jgi:hypothetical protein